MRGGPGSGAFPRVALTRMPGCNILVLSYILMLFRIGTAGEVAMREQVRFFGALSSEPRLRILLLLKEHPQCVKAIVTRLKLTQSAVSQHLRVLREAGLVKARKSGPWMHYQVDERSLERCAKDIGTLFGGWAKLQPAGKGTHNCPPVVLAECGGGRSPRTRSARRA